MVKRKIKFCYKKHQTKQIFSKFDLQIKLPNKKIQNIKNFKIPLLGIHNVRNAVGAIAVALDIGIPISNIKSGLVSFKGVQEDLIKSFHIIILIFMMIMHITQLKLNLY